MAEPSEGDVASATPSRRRHIMAEPREGDGASATLSRKTPASDEPTTGLIREAFDETRDLVRLEVALARVEMADEIAHTKAAAMALGGGVAAFVSAFTLLMVALASAIATARFATMWPCAAALGVLLAVVGALFVAAGRKALPKKLLAETRQRIQADVDQLKERIV